MAGTLYKALLLITSPRVCVMAVTISNRLFENMHEVANTTYLSTAVIYDRIMCITLEWFLQLIFLQL